jgi:hypothetical protein
MRTKTLLLTAALCAAGAATSMAQVYSVNMVGYINQSVPAGYSAIANHLNNSPDNRVTSLLTAPPDGTRIYKFNPTTGGFIFIQFIDGAWEGDDTTITLGPGEGAFVFAPSAFTQTFVGEVALSSSVSLPSGFSMVSSALPQALPLSGAPPAGLAYPVGEGDRIYQYNPTTGGFIFNQFIDGAWEGDGGGTAPSVAIGESFYAFNAGASAKSWNRTFSVGP